MTQINILFHSDEKEVKKSCACWLIGISLPNVMELNSNKLYNWYINKKFLWALQNRFLLTCKYIHASHDLHFSCFWIPWQNHRSQNTELTVILCVFIGSVWLLFTLLRVLPFTSCWNDHNSNRSFQRGAFLSLKWLLCLHYPQLTCG